jgi:hypothetical protein
MEKHGVTLLIDAMITVPSVPDRLPEPEGAQFVIKNRTDDHLRLRLVVLA